MVVSAQWELVRGNSFGYTVLSAFGLFYAGFGAIDTPVLGLAAAYGSNTVDYNNALGFFVLCEFTLPPWKMSFSGLFADMIGAVWSVFNFFFLVGSLPM